MQPNDQSATTPDTMPNTPAATPDSASTVPGSQPNETKSVTSQPNSVTHTDDNSTDKTDTSDPTEPETPDWFMKDKFKSIEDQARSYKDLVGKMGKFWGSPEDNYKPDGIDGLEENDPLVSALTPALKELGISQDGFAHLVNGYMAANREMLKGFEDNLRQTLTTTDAHTFQAVDKWMNDNLSKEEATQVKNNWLMTPEDFKLFNNLRLMAAPSTNVPNNGQAGAAFESADAVTNEKVKYRQEVKQGIRVKDKNFENELSSRHRDAVARELRVKGR